MLRVHALILMDFATNGKTEVMFESLLFAHLRILGLRFRHGKKQIRLALRRGYTHA